VYEIHIAEFGRDFEEMWLAARQHLDHQVDGGIPSWLKGELVPPFLEHLSFRLGNQLFFIRLVDIDEHLKTPGSLSGLKVIARECLGHPCLMPMRRRSRGWEPMEPGWGLLDALTCLPIDPAALVDDRQILMTPWELHHMAVQTVRLHLQSEGHGSISWQGNPHVEPAIWFDGGGGLEWVVVRSAVYPETPATCPATVEQVARHIGDRAVRGHFASVYIANALDPDRPPVRGGPLHGRSLGLDLVAGEFASAALPRALMTGGLREHIDDQDSGHDQGHPEQGRSVKRLVERDPAHDRDQDDPYTRPDGIGDACGNAAEGQ